MRIQYRIAAAVALGMMAGSWAVAQSSEAKSVEAQTQTRTIAPEDQPTKEQMTRLFDAMRLRQQLDGYFKMLPAMVQQQMKSQTEQAYASLGVNKPSAEDQAALDKLVNRYMERAFNIITIDEMLDDMTTIYQRHLSRTDVDAYIAFYGSPAGQHLLDAQPTIMKEYMPMVTARVAERSKALTADMVKDIQALAKEQQVPAAKKPVAK